MPYIQKRMIKKCGPSIDVNLEPMLEGALRVNN